jgi:hypothetical protein
MPRDVVTIYDSDEENVGEVPSARTDFRPRDKASRATTNCPIVDLTGESPPTTKSFARMRAVPQPRSPTRSKSASPIIQSCDDEDELPDDPTPKSFFARRPPPSGPRLGLKPASSSSSLRNTSRPSSPNKRPRDEKGNIEAHRPPEKRCRLVPSDVTSDEINSSAFRSLRLDTPRKGDPQPASLTATLGDQKSRAGATDDSRIGSVTNVNESKQPTSARPEAVLRIPVNGQVPTQARLVEPHIQEPRPACNDQDEEGGSHSDPVGSTRNRQTGLTASTLTKPIDLSTESSRTLSKNLHKMQNTTPSSQLYREAGEDLHESDRGVPSLPGIALISDDQPKELELPTLQAHAAADVFVLPEIQVFPVERQVERILGKYYQEMREDTEYFTKAWLKRSRRSIELHRERPLSTHSDALKSGKSTAASAVFARLRTAAFTPPTTATAKVGNDHFKVNIYIYDGADKPIRIFVKVKPVRRDVTRIANDVPEYAHYVTLKSNILAPNTTTMNVWPYFGDDEPDPEEFEHYYYLDTDQRHRKIQRLLESQKIEEYIESALQDLHITWDDVLRFLLEPNPEVGTNDAAKTAITRRDKHKEDFPKVEHSEKWTEVLSSLCDTTQEKLIKAAILCDNFQRMAKFPLWHVARRSATVKRIFQAQDTPTSSVESRVCRICLQFNCHQHGELQEHYDDVDSGAETDGAVAKDILYPLRVNFRKRATLPLSLPPKPADNDVSVSVTKTKKAPKYWEKLGVTGQEEWPPFYPCHHPGETCVNANCSCFVDKRPCERSCTCSIDCHRKFQGCSCASFKHKKPGDFVCWRDDRCACYRAGRECDPDLCGSCGVCEVLDPVHRNNHDATDVPKMCQNASMQRGISKHTLLGDSGIHGMGLYAGQHIKAHELIGEYKGELITTKEADRRGAIYEKQKLTYLFKLNDKQEVDSNFYGNKIRFINHREKPGANVYPLIMLANTVHRIGLFAQQDLKPGEELFFDYGHLFTDHALGGNKSAAGSESTHHVRNSKAITKGFYDVEDGEDEVGNKRARKAAVNGKHQNRPRQPGSAADPIKPKKKMGGVRPGASRKPGKASRAAAKSRKAADDFDAGGSRIMSHDNLESYHVSREKDRNLKEDVDDGNDQDFVAEDASEQESSADDEDSEVEGVRLGVSRYGRMRGKPRKLEW